MLPVGVNIPVDGSYSSAVLSGRTTHELHAGTSPPATSTFPVASNVAECPTRALCILPVDANVPSAGSYNSAEASAAPELSVPPVISTFPLDEQRRRVVGARRLHAPGWHECAGGRVIDLCGVVEENRTPDARVTSDFAPPATSIFPLGSKVAECSVRVASMFPVGVNAPTEGS